MTDQQKNGFTILVNGRDRHRLSPPIIRQPTVERLHVLRSLEAARTRRMSLMVAPAGFGKTTVLVQWRAQLLTQDVAVVWYTASERDREPAKALQMLSQAAHLSGVDLAASVVLEGATSSVDATLDALLLALDNHSGEVVIVIDDYHKIESDGIATLVEAVVQTASEKTHVVLACRRKPQLAVSALLAQGGARIFEASELRMSPRELAGLLQLPVGSAEVEDIAEYTQGWPATAELYKLWRQNALEADILTGLVVGRSTEVSDYLTEQVFALLGPDLQVLLQDVSRLGEIQAELVDVVRRRTDSAALLEDLSRTLPGLVQNTAVASQTYQMHPLLLDYARLRSGLNAAHERSLHQRASGWFEQKHRYEEAVGHASASGDIEFLDALLARLKPLHIFLHGGAAELRAILRRTPPERVSAHPRLQLMAALAHLKSGFFAESWAMVEKVGKTSGDFRLDPHGNGNQLIVEAYAIQLILIGYMDGTSTRAEILSTSIVALASDDPIMWAWCENIMIVIQQQRGDFIACRNAIARTRALYDSNGMTIFAEAQVPAHEMLLAFGQGALRVAGDLATDSRQSRRLPIGTGAPVSALSKIILAMVDYEHRFSDIAIDVARTALESLGDGEIWAEPIMVVYGPAVDLVVRRDGVAGLRRVIDDLSARTKRTGMRSLTVFLTALEVIGLVRLGETDQAAAGVRQLEDVRAAHASQAPSSWRERDSVSSALILWRIAISELDRAMIEADAFIQYGVEEGRTRTQIKGNVLKAIVLEALGDRDQALAVLYTALNLAQTQSFVAVFAEEGPALQPLLQAMLGANQFSPAAHRHAEVVLKTIDLGQRRPDAINEREAEILAHLMEGASNKLIARRMGVTDNTIKFHLKKIFAKLGVTGRKAAAAAARESA